MIPLLYHYTCLDSWALISHYDRLLRPHRHPWLAEPLVWLTDMAKPHGGRLGLTQEWISCDRTVVRIGVRCAYVVPWEAYANAARVRGYVQQLMAMPPARADRWWISTAPIPLERATIEETWAGLRRAKVVAHG